MRRRPWLWLLRFIGLIVPRRLRAVVGVIHFSRRLE